ncbi:hypothetical protein M758_11G041400 [Ceratodon purpureus]|nr:hypothetical protein M758_11G041400 [Ceratodon purpureus]
MKCADKCTCVLLLFCLPLICAIRVLGLIKLAEGEIKEGRLHTKFLMQVQFSCLTSVLNFGTLLLVLSSDERIQVCLSSVNSCLCH